MNLFAQFHFLRAWWLLLLIPAALLAFALWKQRSSSANWRRAIAPELIDYLIEPMREQQRRWPLLLSLAWIFAIIAIAGPTWEKLPQPVLQKRDGLVIVLDLSLSMYAQDIQPSRLQRARYKVLDILERRREGLTGLVVYSGDAHVVAPLTDDVATIANLVPALSPAMMPANGSDPTAAVDMAKELLRNAGFERGRVLLISDEISAKNIDEIATRFDNGQWQLAIIGVGTEQGAPIPLPSNQTSDQQSGFIKQHDGTIAIAQLHRERFTDLANKTHARYSDIHLDDGDLDTVLSNTIGDGSEVRTVQREFDQWRERGPQLVWLLTPLAALAFRRGWLLGLLVVPLSLPVQAVEWRDLWRNADQQAQQQLNDGNAKAAAEKFRDPSWRGTAQYRVGDYQNAAKTFSSIDNADAQYNRGNALARAGDLKEAIAAYDAALKKNPDMEDAKANRDLLQKLLKQQQKNPPQKNESSQGKQQQETQNKNQGQSQSQKNNQQQQQANAQKMDASNAKPSTENSGKQGENQDGSMNQPEKNAENKPESQKKEGNSSNDNHNAQQSNENAAVKRSESADNPEQKKNSQAAQALENSQQMQQRATEQWLRQIPDDPSGLLRRKFIYENRQRERNAPPRSDQPAW